MAKASHRKGSEGSRKRAPMLENQGMASRAAASQQSLPGCLLRSARRTERHGQEQRAEAALQRVAGGQFPRRAPERHAAVGGQRGLERLLAEGVEVGIGEPGIEKGGERVAGEDGIADQPGGGREERGAGSARRCASGRPRGEHVERRRERHDESGQFDGVTEARGEARDGQPAGGARLAPGQQGVEGGEDEEDERGVVVGGGGGDADDGGAEVEGGGGERNGVGEGETAADRDEQGDGGEQKAECTSLADEPPPKA